MKQLFFYAVLFSFFISSCSEDNMATIDDVNGKTVVSYKVTPDEAQEIVQDFIDITGVDTQTRNGGAPLGREISDIGVLRNSLTGTRSQETSSSIDLDTLMYVVNFANNNGFVLVAADKRTEPIFAFVDEGNLDFEKLEDVDNEMFLSFLDYAIATEFEDIENFKADENLTRATSKGWSIRTKYLPILKTKWSQGGENNPNSYGKYCPNKITGCTVTATAQILSHFQTIGHVNWSYNGMGGSSTLHWDQIISDCEKYNGVLTPANTPQSLNEVAHLCRYLGNAFGTKYKKGTTSVGENKAIDWFNKWGGLKASKLKKYDENPIINAIKNGNPVYGRGNSGRKKFLGITVKYKGGHAWVYDGYISAIKNGKQQNLIHCNWGWGSSISYNGYYLSKVFDTNSGPEIKDTEVTRSGSSNNYKYNLEYSVISR